MSLEVDVRKLEVFNKIAKEGSRTVADSLGQLTGVDAGIKVSKINLLHLDDVQTHLGDQTQVGIHVELTSPPYGYVLFLMDPQDSKQLAGLMLPGEGTSDENGFSDMERSAIQEIGNILTSGYIDGLANVLETTIDMGTPEFTYGPASAIVQKMGGWPDEDLVFVLDSRITTEHGDVGLTAYTFPQLRDLVELVQQLDLETDVKRDTVADDIVD
ncbi:MAG: chemotaxis protein CheC [Haloarculaceae archaeon]